jgi:hypothetical protein
MTKPHLAFALLVFLLARGERRAIIGAVAAVAAQVGVSLLLVGVHGTLAFASAPQLSADVSPVRSMLGLSGLFSSDLGPGLLAAVLAALGGCLAIVMAAALGRTSRRDPARLEAALAGATVLSLLCTPHLLVHDLVVLAPALVWSIARASAATRELAAHPWREAALIGLWAAMGEAALLDLHSYTGGDFGRLVPWTLLLAAGLSVVACRRGPRSRDAVCAVHRPVTIG